MSKIKWNTGCFGESPFGHYGRYGKDEEGNTWVDTPFGIKRSIFDDEDD
ncbi:MAG: hypothetical protein AAGF96_06005 [Bacteroidota bacterium]